MHFMYDSVHTQGLKSCKKVSFIFNVRVDLEQTGVIKQSTFFAYGNLLFINRNYVSPLIVWSDFVCLPPDDVFVFILFAFPP